MTIFLRLAILYFLALSQVRAKSKHYLIETEDDKDDGPGLYNKKLNRMNRNWPPRTTTWPEHPTTTTWHQKERTTKWKTTTPPTTTTTWTTTTPPTTTTTWTTPTTTTWPHPTTTTWHDHPKTTTWESRDKELEGDEAGVGNEPIDEDAEK